MIARSCFIALVAVLGSALAQEPSLLKQKRDELGQLENELKRHETLYQKLGDSHQEVLAQVAKLTLALRKKNQSLADNERAILETQADIDRLTQQQQDLSKTFLSYNKNLGQILSVMVSFDTYDPGKLLFYPGTPIEATRSVGLIDSLTPWFSDNGQKVTDKLGEVSRLKEQLTIKKNQRAQERGVVLQDLSEMQTLIETRELKIAAIAQQRKQLSGDISDILEQVQSLQEVIEKLNQTLSNTRRPQGIRDYPIKGKITMPIVGVLLNRYGQKQATGYVEKELKLKGEANTIVRAPFDGRVYLSQDLGSYGQVLFVVHNGQGNFVSALYGLGQVIAENEQWVLEGDPIGSANQTGQIGFILTRNDDFVNPTVWLDGL